MEHEIFENLFILEMANNHWGSLERGKRIIKEFAQVVRYNNVKAAIKLQFRDVETFVHSDFTKDSDRYIQKTVKTKLFDRDIEELVDYIRQCGCIPMATPFDERSVQLCVDLDLPIIKIASSDINDWILLKAIAATEKPVIFSTGGASEKQIDDAVAFFENRNIPLAINHCVSKYPSEDSELELNQIDYLKNRYPNHVIGFSTHEKNDWQTSMNISYAKGARTWERHVDIRYKAGECEQKMVSSYCSQPEQIDEWFKAFKYAQTMCGNSSQARRIIDVKESEYLENLYRGFYLRADMVKGESVKLIDLYSAIPYQAEIGQLTSRDFLEGFVLNKDKSADSPLTKQDIE